MRKRRDHDYDEEDGNGDKKRARVLKEKKERRRVEEKEDLREKENLPNEKLVNGERNNGTLHKSCSALKVSFISHTFVLFLRVMHRNYVLQYVISCIFMNEMQTQTRKGK